MQNAASGGASVQSDDRNGGYHSIVADLVSMIEQIQTGMSLIDTAIAGELPLGNQELAGNVVVLDDVTPRYARAGAAVSACNAGLGAALHFLRDTRSPNHRSERPAERSCRRVVWIGRS